MTVNTSELVVQLSRGNADQARSLAQRVQADLSAILSSEPDAANPLRHQAQQTLFAIEEVLGLMDQSDIRGALAAARDAAKEWRSTAELKD